MRSNNNDLLMVTTENFNISYGVAGSLVPSQSATDILTIQGGQGATVRVKRITLTGAASAATAFPVSLIRRAQPNTGGTYVALPVIKMDAADGSTSNTTIVSTSGVTINAANSYQTGNGIIFSSTGGLTGVNSNTYYYITSATPYGFTIAATSGGTAIFPGYAVAGVTVAGTAVAVVNAYTTNATSLGSAISVGPFRQQLLTLPLSGAQGNPLIWQWGDKNDKALILRGSNDIVSVNLNNYIVPGGVINFEIAWEEDNS